MDRSVILVNKCNNLNKKSPPTSHMLIDVTLKQRSKVVLDHSLKYFHDHGKYSTFVKIDKSAVHNFFLKIYF